MNCADYERLTLTLGLLDLGTNVLVLAFPIPMVLRLKISAAQRVYLLVIFLFGGMYVTPINLLGKLVLTHTFSAVIACIARIVYGAKSMGNPDMTMAQYRYLTLL